MNPVRSIGDKNKLIIVCSKNIIRQTSNGVNKILKTLGTLALLLLLLIFTIAFFLYKQYWLAFFSLALILIFPRWGQVKKIIIGKDKVEVQIPEDIIKKEQKEK